MCRVIAVSNQKGGVGKTVSCVNLGIGLAQEGKKVLMIDADPQGSLTISLGYEEPDEMEYSLATLMMNIVNDEKLNIEKTILHHKEGVDLIPANIELSAIEVSLVNAMSRELILRSMVDRLREFYDYIIIDCMPSLGMMTINALIGYIHYEAPEEEQNFSTLLEMINAMEVREDDEEFKNPVDMMFDELAEQNPDHFAVRQYAKYKLAAGKTAKSILVSCGARLAPFDIKELRDLTAYDELELDTLGDEKTALFLIMSDTDGTFNFLISMIYTQMFNLLCEKADDVYGGRLPVHVRCLIDEAANIGQIPNLEKLVATIRSREISACLVLQAKSQLKAIYKDNADTIIGNMDSQIFLGGTEQTTLKDLNAILGKETIDMYNTGQSKGSQESYNMNYQKLGKDLMTMDELAVMDGSKCIVQVRGVRPFLSDKYDLTQHPNYKLTADYDKRNYFDVVKFLSHNLILKADDEYQVIDVTE